MEEQGRGRLQFLNIQFRPPFFVHVDVDVCGWLSFNLVLEIIMSAQLTLEQRYLASNIDARKRRIRKIRKFD
jgi:hypothetical protein